MSNIKDSMVYGSGWTFSGKKSKKFPYTMYRDCDLKEAMIKFTKEKYHPDKTTIEIADLWDFFNITDEDIIEDAQEVVGE